MRNVARRDRVNGTDDKQLQPRSLKMKDQTSPSFLGSLQNVVAKIEHDRSTETLKYRT